jgi:hypothetical protein
MDGYQIALFVHLLALFAAFGASTVIHVSMTRIRSARSGAEALDWLGAAHALSRVFPLSLAALVGTGAWMLHDAWSWSSGFVLAGLTGVAFLFLSGAVIEGGQARKLAAALAARPAEPPAVLARDPLWWCASWANTGVAVGVTFAMVTKPSAEGAFAALAVGAIAGAAAGLLARGGEAPSSSVTRASPR